MRFICKRKGGCLKSLPSQRPLDLICQDFIANRRDTMLKVKQKIEKVYNLFSSNGLLFFSIL